VGHVRERRKLSIRKGKNGKKINKKNTPKSLKRTLNLQGWGGLDEEVFSKTHHMVLENTTRSGQKKKDAGQGRKGHNLFRKKKTSYAGGEGVLRGDWGAPEEKPG